MERETQVHNQDKEAETRSTSKFSFILFKLAAGVILHDPGYIIDASLSVLEEAAKPPEKIKLLWNLDISNSLNYS